MEHYQPVKDRTESIRTSSYWLRKTSFLMGVWPAKLQTSLGIPWYRVLYRFTLAMHWINTYLQLEFFCHNLGNLNLVVQGLCSFISITTTGIKCMRLHSYEEEISRIWKTIESGILFRKIHFLAKGGNNKGIFVQFDAIAGHMWKEVHLNLRFYTTVVGAVASSYSIIPLCSYLYHLLQGQSINRKLVYNTYYPYMEMIKYRSPLYELLFCTESMSGYTTWAGVVAFDGLYVVFVLYATSLLRLLNELMQETTNPTFTDPERAFLLRECLLHHGRVIRLVQQINEIFSPLLLLQLFTSTAIICVIAFAATFSEDAGDSQTMLMVLYLIAAVYQLFQFCWYGQRLQNESNDLPVAVYNARWELCSPEFKRSHHILLLFSQRRIELRAWSFSAMSLETFSKIIKSAASYFTVLQSLAEE
ncbi:odorant receptor 63a-like [Anopheles aquasalis]|uniref:odorant receptor 63a-like n=1 Tax=Anopheles aquasalis TaxID=42839 RepID=UPI00215B06CE|nr:odorant receptor 63a-like [Anopheles aquasalis]